MDGRADIGNVFRSRQFAVVIGAPGIDLRFFHFGPLLQSRLPGDFQVHFCRRNRRHWLGAKGSVNIPSQQLVHLLLLGVEGIAQLDDLIPGLG